MRALLVLVVICVLLNVANTFASAATLNRPRLPSLSSTDIQHENTPSGRLLRVAAAGPEAEERSLFSYAKLVASRIGNSAKTSYWAYAGYTGDDVMAKLGLVGLRGKALTNHPKFPVYQNFIHKANKVKLSDMVRKNVQTEDVWAMLKLDKMTETQRRGSQELAYYEYFARKFDKRNFGRMVDYGDDVFTIGKNSAEEMAVKINLWVKYKYGDTFVKRMLGIDRLSKAQLEHMPTRHYYEAYKKLLRAQAEMGVPRFEPLCATF